MQLTDIPLPPALNHIKTTHSSNVDELFDLAAPEVNPVIAKLFPFNKESKNFNTDDPLTSSYSIEIRAGETQSSYNNNNNSNKSTTLILPKDYVVALVIGRSSKLIPMSCRINHPRLSSRHCEIILKKKKSKIEDNSTESHEVYIRDISTNGTFVNSSKIMKRELIKLKNGDIISLINCKQNDDDDRSYAQTDFKFVLTCSSSECIHENLDNINMIDIKSIPGSSQLLSLKGRKRGREGSFSEEDESKRSFIGMISDDEDDDIDSDDIQLYEKDNISKVNRLIIRDPSPLTPFRHMPSKWGPVSAYCSTIFYSAGFHPSSANIDRLNLKENNINCNKCSWCCTPSLFDGFQCSVVNGTPHLLCTICDTLFPNRPLSSVPQRCMLCAKPFCDIYAAVHGMKNQCVDVRNNNINTSCHENNSSYNVNIFNNRDEFDINLYIDNSKNNFVLIGGCKNKKLGQGYLKPLKCHTMKKLPFGLFNGNVIEQKVLTNYINTIVYVENKDKKANLNNRDNKMINKEEKSSLYVTDAEYVVPLIWNQCLSNFSSNHWLPDLLLSTSGSLCIDSIVCKLCAENIFAALLYHYRRAIDIKKLPHDVVFRQNCQHGINCRVQFHSITHAQLYNHVCPEERQKG